MAAIGFKSYFVLFLLVRYSACQGSNSPGYSRITDVNIDCVQCNMRQLGILNTCENPAQRHNCTGCVKTYTKIRIKDSGDVYGKFRTSEVTSRYCMRNGATNAKEEGCYRHLNNGGYTVQCFCYTHNCNSPANTLRLDMPAILLSALLFTVATRVTSWL